MPNVEAVVVNSEDNVATAVVDIPESTKVSVKIGEELKEFQVRHKIPFGHKFALRKIAKGEDVIKYGECIGKATADIEAGEHVHIHNVKSVRGRGDLIK